MGIDLIAQNFAYKIQIQAFVGYKEFHAEKSRHWATPK